MTQMSLKHECLTVFNLNTVFMSQSIQGLTYITSLSESPAESALITGCFYALSPPPSMTSHLAGVVEPVGLKLLQQRMEETGGGRVEGGGGEICRYYFLGLDANLLACALPHVTCPVKLEII